MPIFSVFLPSLFRSELAERETMLRTKAMREREEMKERRKYRFCLIRVRFPDGLVLQVLLPKITFQLGFCRETWSYHTRQKYYVFATRLKKTLDFGIA